MKFGELLGAYAGRVDGDMIHLSVEGVDKEQAVSSNAEPLLYGIMDWFVDWFDVVDGKLFVKVKMSDDKPF